MNTQLSGSHKKTYDAIFHHPMPHNLQWREVKSMLETLADQIHEHEGTMKVTLNKHTLVLHEPVGKNIVNMHELIEIRRFLKQSAELHSTIQSEGAHLLVVIDHREARIYKAELHGSLPQRIAPYDPHGFGRYLHNVEDESDGQRKPELGSFYEAVARTLLGADKVLIFGSGTGASSAMDWLMAELKSRHPEVAGKVIGTIVVDEQHMTEDQILARARECYAKISCFSDEDLKATKLV